MIRSFTLLALIALSLFFSCSAEPQTSALEKINANVSAYFFLPDSIEVEVEIVDTLSTIELQEMIDQVNKNLNLIDRDLDTLSLMIDDQAYAALYLEQDLEKLILLNRNQLQDSLQRATKRKIEYELKQAQLLAKKQIFKQTNRILLHLKRGVRNDVAGFNIGVHYLLNDEMLDLELLLDANFNVVD